MMRIALQQILDSMLTATVRPKDSGALEYARTILRPSTRRFDRPAAALNFIDAVIPGAASALAQCLIRSAKLPFRAFSTEVLDYGSGDTVFLLTHGEDQIVMKVQRESIGRSYHELLRLVWARRDNFESVIREYAPFEYFPPTYFAIVHGPILGTPVVVSIQPFIPGEKRDVFHELSDEQLFALVSDDDRLRKQLDHFVQTARRALDRNRWVVDIGKNNLLLVKNGGHNKLVFTDCEMLDLNWVRETGRYEQYLGHLERAGGIVEEAIAARSVPT